MSAPAESGQLSERTPQSRPAGIHAYRRRAGSLHPAPAWLQPSPYLYSFIHNSFLYDFENGSLREFYDFTTSRDIYQ